MGFFDAISRGINLSIASVKIVLKEPWMFVLPIISGMLMALLLVSFYLINWVLDLNVGTIGVAVMVLFIYLVGYFLFYFTQAMVIFAAKERFEGRDPTMVQSYSAAMGSIAPILMLSVIGSIVGLITSALSGRRGSRNLIGSILASVIGMSWTIVSYFSLPIILNEKIGVFESFGRSVELVKKSWGEGVVANISLGVLMVPGIVGIILSILLGFASPMLGILGFIISLLLFFVGYIILIVSKGIVSEALYIYAQKGIVPQGFDENEVMTSFGSKEIEKNY